MEEGHGEGQAARSHSSSSPVHSRKSSPTAASASKEKGAKANRASNELEGEGKKDTTTADSSEASEKKEGPDVVWV